MPLETTLFILRIVIAVLLYTFLGALLWLALRDVRMAAESGGSGRHLGQLVVVEGEDAGLAAGQSFPLLPTTSIGRAATNRVVIDDTFASSEHAVLVRRGSQWWLEDHDSRNGTTLNGHLLEEPVVVSAGDIIGVGRVRLRLELESPR